MSLNIDAIVEQLWKRVNQNIGIEMCGHESTSHHTISQQILNYYFDYRQSVQTLKKKVEIKNQLLHVLRNELTTTLGEIELFIVGSSVTGLAADHSDCDLCLVEDSPFALDVRSHRMAVLSKVESILQSSSGRALKVSRISVINARMPVLRAVVDNIVLELNVNNMDGIRNTRLMYCYSVVDHRLPPLSLMIKKWAKDNYVNDSHGGTLSSFAIQLMIISYLQCCSPPVLPSLQALESSSCLFDANIDVRQFVELPAIDRIDWQTSNRQTVGQLFANFVGYYSHSFDFYGKVMSIRLGKTMSRNEICNRDDYPNDWQHILVEEPFNGSNVCQTVFKYHCFNRIVVAFQKSFHLIQQNKLQI